MKFQQLIVTVKLLENDSKDFPVPTLPKVILEGTRIFIDDIRPALEAAQFLMNRIGINIEISDDLFLENETWQGLDTFLP